MKQYFMNYSPLSGISLNTYRNNGLCNGDDLVGFCEDVQREKESNFTVVRGECLKLVGALEEMVQADTVDTEITDAIGAYLIAALMD